ncbi:MAG: dephospho-CoA kinase [Sedimentisphaerales bacterium]|nr:dephospho-CoA kinase [Sedimentisphaerales bacterium]
MKNEKPIIGIMGGIGSGKSTVAAEFAKLGCKIIDADKIAHDLLEENDIREQVIALFSNDIIDSQGKIDRKKTAEIVFNNSELLFKLNNIIHPGVLQKTEELIEQYNKDNLCKAIILDMPLLVEVGWDKRCDKLIFVDCDEKTRENRKKNKFFEKNHIKNRENFQISLDKKKDIADNTVNNNSDFSTLVRQIAEIFSYIMMDEC